MRTAIGYRESSPSAPAILDCVAVTEWRCCAALRGFCWRAADPRPSLLSVYCSGAFKTPLKKRTRNNLLLCWVWNADVALDSHGYVQFQGRGGQPQRTSMQKELKQNTLIQLKHLLSFFILNERLQLNLPPTVTEEPLTVAHSKREFKFKL